MQLIPTCKILLTSAGFPSFPRAASCSTRKFDVTVFPAPLSPLTTQHYRMVQKLSNDENSTLLQYGTIT